MGTQVLRDQKIYFDGYELTGQTNSVSVNAEREAKECTVFGNDTHNNTAGLKVATIGAAGFWNAQPHDAALFNAIDAEGKLVSIANAAAAMSVAYMLKSMVGKYGYDGQVGEIFPYSLETAAQSSLLRGRLVENRTAFASTGNGTARQLGAVAAGKKLYAGLHVLAAAGSSPTLDVVLKSDSANNFAGAQTTRLTLSQMTGVGGQLKEVSGPITDAWWRPEFTVGGGSPSFDFVFIIAIQ